MIPLDGLEHCTTNRVGREKAIIQTLIGDVAPFARSRKSVGSEAAFALPDRFSLWFKSFYFLLAIQVALAIGNPRRTRFAF